MYDRFAGKAVFADHLIMNEQGRKNRFTRVRQKDKNNIGIFDGTMEIHNGTRGLKRKQII